ncbi:MAG TPA: heparinase II/III family protein [Luteolibacter sp.]|nr:heparinase II/III family protein [Luteolibacter sp.]
MLRTLNPHHPRLMLDAAALEGIRKSVAGDPVAARIQTRILENADLALKKAPPKHRLRDGRRLLYVSSEVLQRVSTLSYAFHMTGRKDYVERAWKDLDAAAGFKDWNPAHFLDTAVMTCALAIGYDWLWDQWTPEQRTRLREAIVKLGLEPAMEVYQADRGWHRVDYNWNQICNAGIAMGALAVAEDEPRLAREIVARAIASIPRAMEAYAPDGAGKEGVGYWAFGSQYNIMLLTSLDSALGKDFGLAGIDGFRQSGAYQIHLSGAGRMSFDFGDCNHFALSTPQHFWMGRRYGIPPYSSFRYNALRERSDGGVWDLLWFDADVAKNPSAELPLDRHFAGAEVASMRDSWIDSRGFTVAMQGGSNRWTHRHYDLGSFILEADGVRWIIDSGKESETYQRHVNKLSREDFYRVRAEGHNTLVIDPDKGPGQEPGGLATFKSFESKTNAAKAVLDLTPAYKEQARRVERTFELIRGKAFVLTDVIACRKASDIHSYFHTAAEVELSPDKRQATLRQAGKSLVANLLSPDGATFDVLPAEPGPASPKPAKQASNEGRRKLSVHLQDTASATIKVVFLLPPNVPGGKSPNQPVR